MIDSLKKELIALEVIRTLHVKFDNFPEDSSGNRNAPFHEAFLRAFSDKLGNKVPDIPFFVSLSSWLHGLSTTLGQSFFENVSHILSDGYKREFTKKKGTVLEVTEARRKSVADIITDLKNGVFLPDLERENNLVFKTSNGRRIEATSFTADVFVELGNQIIAIELKSVRPNAGEMRGEKRKVLEAKAALYNKFPGKKIRYFIGFPFDSTSDTLTGYDKKRFLNSLIDGAKYFATEEVLLADELWDFLSGDKNTMNQILDIINAIATPQFMDKYNFLNNFDNWTEGSKKYKEILQEWFLFREANLLSNNEEIINRAENSPRSQRVLKQPIFKGEKYNELRYNLLSGL